ncbi:MAG: SufE family protein [Alphaproteobacteria bacterium]|nr:SufE family protein [Alphaproteobacteria bacterium]
MTETIDAAITALEDDLALLPDWEERFSYLIDLGKQMAPLAEHERTEATKVRGCASQVWIVPERRDGRLFLRGESDAFLVKGLIAVLLQVYSGRTAEEILAVDPKGLAARLGLSDALTAQRSNGLYSMMQRIRSEAAQPIP